jgi:hypothetical protein
MKIYGRDQILQFLAEVDELLNEPVAIEIIGGAAALLAYAEPDQGHRQPRADRRENLAGCGARAPPDPARPGRSSRSAVELRRSPASTATALS